jgi:hypothetical protein
VSTIVKAAAVQINPVLYSRQGTVEKVVCEIRDLGREGVQFATLSETVISWSLRGTRDTWRVAACWSGEVDAGSPTRICAKRI